MSTPGILADQGMSSITRLSPSQVTMSYAAALRHSHENIGRRKGRATARRETLYVMVSAVATTKESADTVEYIHAYARFTSVIR